MKIIESIKVLLLPIFLLALIFSCLIWLFLDQSTPREFKNPRKTVGTVIKIFDGTRGVDAYVRFYANGKKHVVLSSQFEGMVIGDKYELKYENGNPENWDIIHERPVFLKGEKTGETVGTITKVSTISQDFVRFEYTVFGKKYSRAQDFDKEFHPLEGKKHKVIYWLKNPQRAIIDLKKNRNKLRP